MAQNFPLSPPHTPIPIGSHQRDVHVFTALYSSITITRYLWAQTSASKVSSSLNKKTHRPHKRNTPPPPHAHNTRRSTYHNIWPGCALLIGDRRHRRTLIPCPQVLSCTPSHRAAVLLVLSLGLT